MLEYFADDLHFDHQFSEVAVSHPQTKGG